MIGTQTKRGPLRREVGLLILIAVLAATACGNNRQFDSNTWLKSNARERGRMAEDLVNSRILVGKSIEEARQVLGEPDFTYTSVVQYRIDLGWLFKDPSHYGLQVHLDEKRLVREVKIVD